MKKKAFFTLALTLGALALAKSKMNNKTSTRSLEDIIKDYEQ